MAKEKGKNVLLKVGDGGGPEAFATLGGQETTKMSLSKSTIDSSDKESGDWTESISGEKSATVTASGKAKWPDTDGLEALRAAYESDEPINCQMILNAAGAKYSGPMHVTALDIDGDMKDVTKYSVTLVNADNLTYAAGA